MKGVFGHCNVAGWLQAAREEGRINFMQGRPNISEKRDFTGRAVLV
jgi:hypothetical protein